MHCDSISWCLNELPVLVSIWFPIWFLRKGAWVPSPLPTVLGGSQVHPWPEVLP